MNLLTFQAAEEALLDSVVIAVADAAHADLDMVRSHDPPDLLAGKLAAQLAVGNTWRTLLPVLGNQSTDLSRG